MRPAIRSSSTRRLASESGTHRVNLKVRLKVDSVLDGIWPPVCLVCGQGSDTGLGCCSGCRADMPVMEGYCRTCGLELARTVEACGDCVGRPPPFDRAAAGFGYRAPVASLVQRFKFDRDLAAGRVLARLLAERMVEIGAARPDLMIP
ncbi:MAG TPA: double zinc ribbon domain-containing protein, partial [Wenzhouxiangellaceae bacterium]|nr:double zinc ribbon domain-containing protein [Wenzhouxiangellaceae bacterium]